MSEPLIDVRGLDAGYAGVAVVHGLDLSVGAGEVVALLGPNGAGKTTVLRTLSGLIAPLRGTVSVLGAPVEGGAPHRVARRGLGHVPDDRALFFDLTVEENLRLAVRGGRLQRHEARRRVHDLFPELERLAGRRAGSLSGGEQQMLALGRAVTAGPRCLLVDEMSLGLAPIIVERLLPVIRRLAEELDVGVLMVEQHVRMALAVADRAVVLAHGELRYSGSAARLVADPGLLEASYLGGTPEGAQADVPGV